MEKIESMSNAKIKHAASLHLKKNREKTGEFVAEGIRLAQMAAQSAWSCVFALVTEEAASKDRVKKILETLEGKGSPVYVVSDKLYRKAAATEESQGLLLIMRREKAELDSVSCGKSFLVVLDGVQDPGNAGTILRTADAVGADAVVALQGSVDLFSDKTVRSAMGSHFHLPVIDGVSREDFLDYAEENKIRCFVTALDEKAQPHFNADYKGACAVVFGNEGNGASKELLDSAEHVYIPMRGQAESLNVASAAAVVLYEAFRQRYQSEASSHTK
ncbi:MAG: RNA methyltransferase [Schwartzia sp.]|nr:RNA methyltransferase [Schwartzia sp. (in: firmicutes)]